jgi:transcriptional regulator with XRE-family HTH domain
MNNTLISPDPIDVHVGKRLKLRRNMLKMSQDQLANLVGVTFQQIQKYENGTNRISASRLFKIAKALDTPISFFFEGFESTDSGDYSYADQSNTSQTSEAAVHEEKKRFDPIMDNKTLELVSAYWQIQDPDAREKFYQLVLAMANKS